MSLGEFPHQAERLLTEEDVARRLGITRIAARNRMRRRQIPVVKMGRLNRVLESDLDAYIASLPHEDRGLRP